MYCNDEKTRLHCIENSQNAYSLLTIPSALDHSISSFGASHILLKNSDVCTLFVSTQSLRQNICRLKSE